MERLKDPEVIKRYGEGFKSQEVELKAVKGVPPFSPGAEIAKE